MQRSPLCSRCHHAFGLGKDLGKSYTQRTPLLLVCGHTFCESCLTTLAKQTPESLSCPECEAVTPLKNGESSVKSLWPDLYIMGILALNKSENLNYLKINPIGMIKMPKKKASQPVESVVKTELCSECNAREASCRCDKCDAYMCGLCFDTIHKASKALRKHQAVPISNIIDMAEDKTCDEHKGRILEYFCERDKVPICSHCFIVGDHQGHPIVALEEKNSVALKEIQVLIPEANKVVSLLKKSDKVLKSVAPDVKLDAMQLIDGLKVHFEHLHGLLQARELALLQRVEDLLYKETQPMDDIRTTILDNLRDVEQLVLDAKKLISNRQDVTMDPGVILQKLQSLPDIPCHIDYNSDSTTELSCKFADEFPNAVREYGEIDIKSGLSVKILKLGDVSEEVITDAVNNLPEIDSVSASDDTESVDTRSVVSEASSGSGIVNRLTAAKKLQKTRIISYKQELVYVTHIRNPCCFMVQRLSDYDRVTTMGKNIKRFCKSPEANEAKVRSVEIDDFVLCQFEMDSNWYRARVTDVNIGVSPMAIEVFYVDYGNTALVTMDKLRKIQPRFLKVPELSMTCSLCDISPTDGKTEWGDEVISAFVKMTQDKPMVMSTLGHTDNVAKVDLSKPGIDEIEDDRPVSMRDAFVFLELAVFTSPLASPMALLGNCKSGGLPGAHYRRYLPIVLPRVKDTIRVVVSHIESPNRFFVQMVGEEAEYLTHMMGEMQRVYMRDRNDLYSIFVPQKSMICVAQFQQDGAWYRAEVVDLPGRQMVVVKYIDFGNTDTVHFTKLKKVKDEFRKLTKQAIECELADVEPISGEWSEDALQLLASYYQSNTEIYVKEIINGKLSVVIPHKIDGLETNLNAMLVQYGLAKSTGTSSKVQINQKSTIGLPSDNTSHSASPANAAVSKESTPKPVIVKPDSPPLTQVILSHIVTPSHMYVQLHSAEVDGLAELMQQLQAEFMHSAPPDEVTWKKGDFCAVCVSRNGVWYRGKIEEIKEKDGTVRVQVHLIDYGLKEILEQSELRKLSENYKDKPCFCVLCHLSDIQPAGDITKWSQTAIEAFREKVENATLYVVQNSDVEGVSLPIDLLMEEHVQGGALTAHQINYASLSEWLKDRGLALPKRKSAIKPAQVASDEPVEVVQPSMIPVPPTAASKPDLVETSYIPPDPPEDAEMQMIATYVDYDAIVHAQPYYPDTHTHGRFGYILKENTIEIVLQDKYLKEKGLHRARIVKDGNCLFRCFAQGIWADQNRYMDMRKALVDGIGEEWELINGIIVGQDKERYLAEMGQNAVYGGEPEIQAICYLMQVSVKIYLGGLNYTIQEREYGDRSLPCVQLSYVSDGHYDSGHYDLVVSEAEVVETVERGYEEWREMRLVELTQMPNYYDKVYYDESLVGQLMVTLQTEYQNSSPEPGNTEWKVTQSVVARYPDDSMFYRAIIQDISNDATAKVLFIDFGDSKTVLKTDLRRKTFLPLIPAQCYRLIINEIRPLTDGTGWDVKTLEYIHNMVVNNTCNVRVKQKDYQLGEDLCCDIRLPDGSDVATHLIVNGLVRRVDDRAAPPVADKPHTRQFLGAMEKGVEDVEEKIKRMGIRENGLLMSDSSNSSDSSSLTNSPLRPPGQQQAEDRSCNISSSSLSSSGTVTPVNVTPQRPAALQGSPGVGVRTEVIPQRTSPLVVVKAEEEENQVLQPVAVVEVNDIEQQVNIPHPQRVLEENTSPKPQKPCVVIPANPTVLEENNSPTPQKPPAIIPPKPTAIISPRNPSPPPPAAVPSPGRELPAPIDRYVPVQLGGVNDLVPVQVTEICNPAEVYIQFLKQESARGAEQERVDKLMNKLLETGQIIQTEKENYPMVQNVEPGLACCAQFSVDQTWYRSEVIQVEGDQCRVLFVDYGNSEVVPCSSLKHIPPDLLDLPAMAVRCRLEGIQPPAIGSWTVEDQHYMVTLLEGVDLIAGINELTPYQDPVIELYGIREFMAKGIKAGLQYRSFIEGVHRGKKSSSGSEQEQFVVPVMDSVSGGSMDSYELIGDSDCPKSWADMTEEESEE